MEREQIRATRLHGYKAQMEELSDKLRDGCQSKYKHRPLPIDQRGKNQTRSEKNQARKQDSEIQHQNRRSGNKKQRIQQRTNRIQTLPRKQSGTRKRHRG